MPRWLYGLLPFALAALIAELLALPAVLVFAVAAIGLIPLAGLIGRATEDLAHHLGPRAGGLLNAPFGNAAEHVSAVQMAWRPSSSPTSASIT